MISMVSLGHPINSNMKRTLILVALALGVILGCKKYPDGANFSFNSAMKRIAQRWALTQADLNGTDITSLMQDNFFDIRDDGNMTWESPFGNIVGIWVFNDDKTQFIFTHTATGSKDTFTIIELRMDQLRTQQADGNDTTNATFNPAE